MPTVLVLGGYGLIGSACCRALSAAGFRVLGLGRSAVAARIAAPHLDWRIHDLRQLDAPGWHAVLTGVDVVVNAAGALQDGPGDDLEAIHHTMMARLCAAAPPGLRLVQISAAGASTEATTAFFRSKARGDARVAGSAGPWVILRPGLVLAPEAYGGTALLRGAAALPAVLPEVFRDSPVQTIHIDDLAAAVVAAARGDIPSGTIADLTEDAARPFPALLAEVRAWLGLPPARWRLPVPAPLLGLAGRGADALGWLGWRSPLRRTALTVLGDGIRGDPGPWRAAGGAPPRALEQTLAALPATRQERLFARLYFLLPLAIATLSVFWLASGLIALARPGAAAATLADSALPPVAISVAVIGGALADIGLGLAILWRPCCRAAALGMLGLSLAYLAGGTLWAPSLWLDPLGPLVKVLPAMVLALVVHLGVEPR